MARIGLAFLLLAACSTNPGNPIASPSDPTSIPGPSATSTPPGPVCRVDALAFRNVRQYDKAENLLDGNMAGVIYIQPGDPVPGGMDPEGKPPVLIANGTPRPFVVRMEADRPLVEREMLTADTWAHTTCPVENFGYQTHEHKAIDPNTGHVRFDIVWWKSPQFAGQPDAIFNLTRKGWVRFDLFQQRTGGITPKTIVDVHTGAQDRATGLHEVNAAIFWFEVP